MDGKTHRLGGICFGIGTAIFLFGIPQEIKETSLAATLIFSSSIGSLLPDIDHHNSTITNQIKRGGREILELPLKILGVKPKRRKRKKKTNHQLKQAEIKRQKREAKRPQALRHRGITHSPFFAMLLLILMLLFYPSYSPLFQPYYFMVCLGIFVGIMSHLVLDGITQQGIPLLAPVTYQRYNLIFKLSEKRHKLNVIIVMVIITTALVCFQVK